MKAIKPLVISGPSGSGKTYLMNYLVKNYPFKNLLSTMTRDQRKGERNLIDNEFVNKKKYLEIEESGDFFMSKTFFDQMYGYRRSFVEKIAEDNLIPVAILFTPVVDDFFKEYPESFGVYLYPSSFELLERRMKARNESEDSIKRRLESAKEEIRVYEEEKKSFYQNCFKISDDRDVNKVIEKILDYYNIQP